MYKSIFNIMLFFTIFISNSSFCDHRIQIYHHKELNKTILRKVEIDKNYIIEAFISKSGRLISTVDFIVKCNPKTKIETTEKYKSGKPIILKCDDTGNSLHYSRAWNNTISIWERDIDGFSFYANFKNWNFTKLKQEATLSKAK